LLENALCEPFDAMDEISEELEALSAEVDAGDMLFARALTDAQAPDLARLLTPLRDALIDAQRAKTAFCHAVAAHLVDCGAVRAQLEEARADAADAVDDDDDDEDGDDEEADA